MHPLRVLHTADWHLGQLFYDYDRTFEHSHFLKWLIATAKNLEVDVLLICGDVFDVSNPSSSSMGLYYNFIKEITQAIPNIQVIITAGNHDSASRLEAPRQLLEVFNISVIGLIPKKEDNSIDYEKLIIPLRNKLGIRAAWCMAVPFLRLGDYPSIEKTSQSYSEGVSLFYSEVYKAAVLKQEYDEPIIAMGHLHCLNSDTSPDDKSERVIMGGIEYIPSSAFHPNIAYTALGHIHKAQKLDGRETVRYSGSPIPMSFSELKYKHQVVFFELENGKTENLQSIEIPILVDLIRIPSKAKPLSEVLNELYLLPERNSDKNLSPYLEVRVLLDGPEPNLRYKIETAIENKNVRLVKIEATYNKTKETENGIKSFSELKQMSPVDLFTKIYMRKYNTEAPKELINLFNEVNSDISEK